jgi:hypothetical protein
MYRDGITLEWRITLFYVCAATVLSIVIIAVGSRRATEVAIVLRWLRTSISDHQAAECADLGYTIKPNGVRYEISTDSNDDGVRSVSGS